VKLYGSGRRLHEPTRKDSYESQACMLRCFDHFCLEHYPQETDLTKEIALHWAERRDNEHPSSLEGRISPVRQ
jgi:integrase/recombinase XerD